MNKILPVSIFLLVGMAASAQYDAEFQGEDPRNSQWTQGSTYEKLSINERKPVPYPTLREADVMYARRLERIMDTKEKQNLACRWPQNPLANIVFDAAERGALQAYKNDSFTSTYRSDTVRAMLGTVVYIQEWDSIYNDWNNTSVVQEFNLEDIVRWKIIEDWVFDKQTGEFRPRIVAIAPMYNLMVDGQNMGEFAAFYVKWDEAREILIREEMFNRHNDGARFSYYDFFELRLFSSYVTKEPNVFDQELAEYEELMGNPLGQQLESQKIKEKLMNWESDLWQY